MSQLVLHDTNRKYTPNLIIQDIWANLFWIDSAWIHAKYATEELRLPECQSAVAGIFSIKWDSQAQNLYLKFSLAKMCYHAAVSKPLPQIPIDGNVLSRSRDWLPYCNAN